MVREGAGDASDTAPSRPAALTTLVAAAAVLVVVLAGWAATGGAGDLLGGRGFAAATDAPSESPSARPVDVTRSEDERRERQSTPFGAWVVATVLLLTAVVVALALLALGRSLWRDRGRRRERSRSEADPATTLTPLEPAAVVEAMADDVGEQLRLLDEGSPRNGIVAAWHRFEVQAAAAGLGRAAWETSAEFTMRLLDTVGADDLAATELTAVYRRARFSEHEPDESDREVARTALGRLHRDLQRTS